MRKQSLPLSHLDASGRAHMVDVGEKKPSLRAARAEAVVQLGRTLTEQLRRTGALAFKVPSRPRS
jgi:molybdenum cofactor biosynthesis enzyme